jgi:hypothetical protein
MKYETGKYYKLVLISGDFAIARFDHSKQHNDVGFMFAQPDGFGFMSRADLSGVAKIIPLEIVEVDTDKKKEIFSLIQNANNIVAYSFSCVYRDDSTFTKFHNDWKPAMLIGEMACANKMVIDDEFKYHRKVEKNGIDNN